MKFKFTEGKTFEILCGVDVSTILLFIILIGDNICYLIFFRFGFIDSSLSSKLILVFVNNGQCVENSWREWATGSWPERVNY